MVNPSIIVLIVSPLSQRIPRRTHPPSIMVVATTSGLSGERLLRVTALPSMFTTSSAVLVYVPGITIISSPSLAASTAS